MDRELSMREELLAQPLGVAGSEIRPGEQYSLSLYSTIPNDLLRRLENQFEVSLHREKPASVALKFDTFSQNFYPSGISIPTYSTDNAHLYYIPSINQYYPSLGKKSNLEFRPYTSQELLEGLHIEQPSSLNPEAVELVLEEFNRNVSILGYFCVKQILDPLFIDYEQILESSIEAKDISDGDVFNGALSLVKEGLASLQEYNTQSR